jgi:hypothetical protein
MGQSLVERSGSVPRSWSGKRVRKEHQCRPPNAKENKTTPDPIGSDLDHPGFFRHSSSVIPISGRSSRVSPGIRHLWSPPVHLNVGWSSRLTPSGGRAALHSSSCWRHPLARATPALHWAECSLSFQRAVEKPHRALPNFVAYGTKFGRAERKRAAFMVWQAGPQRTPMPTSECQREQNGSSSNWFGFRSFGFHSSFVIRISGGPHGAPRPASFGGTSNSHCSPKNPALAIPPGAREETGTLISTIAQSGSFGTCRALFR